MFHVVIALVRGSRWRQATKCKSLIKHVKRRLMILKNRRNAIIMQTRADIAQLLQNGLHHIALSRAEHLYKDMCTMSAYDQLENFCDCLYANIYSISKSSEMSSDESEAISSLIFASSRCGELRELYSIRNLFKKHFGSDFDRVNVELLPRHNVNNHMQYNLTVNLVPEDVKHDLVNEISREQTLCLELEVDKEPCLPEHKEFQVRDPSKGNRRPKKKEEQDQLRSNVGRKGQIKQSKFEDMVRRMPRFSFSVNGIFVSFWSDSYSSNRNDASRSQTETRGVGVQNQMNNHERNVLSKRHATKMYSDNRADEQKVASPSFEEEIREDFRPRLGHVHPKLPDYDELVSKFSDLKKENMKNSLNNRSFHKWLLW